MLRFKSDIPKLTLVTFDQEAKVFCGTVLGHRRGKYLVLDENGKRHELGGNRLRKVGGSLKDAADDDGLVKQLTELRNKALEAVTPKVIPELWEYTSDENSELKEEELAVMYYGETKVIYVIGLRIRLIEEGSIHFKRVKRGFVPRSEQAMEEVRLKRERDAEAASRREAAVTAMVECLKGERGSTLSEEQTEQISYELYLLSQYAALDSNMEGPKAKEAKKILAETKRALGNTWEEIKLPKTLKHSEEAYALLVALGVFEKHENLALHRYEPPRKWSKQQKELAQSLRDKGTSTFAEESDRLDLTSLPAFTIDDETTMDMDDAFSVVQTDQGFQIGIHISDVSAVIEKDSLLDKCARFRASSIYMPGTAINMLPEELSEDAISLVAGEDRPSLSLLIETDRHLDILSTEFKKTLIRSAKKYTYDEVDALLDQDHPPFDLLTVYKVASNHEVERVTRGASSFTRKEINVHLPEDEDACPLLRGVDMNSPARLTVSEMMVLYNQHAATVAAKAGIPFPFRTQPVPEDNPDLDLESIPEGPAREFARRTTMKRSEISLDPKPHYSLALDYYTQVTSPIRRFLDLVCQRQLKAHLSGQPSPYSSLDMERMLMTLGDALGRTHTVARETKRYWLLEYLRHKMLAGERLSGVVLRTDHRGTLVDIEEVGFNYGVRPENPPPAGSHVELEITAVNPRVDYLRLKVVE